MKALVTLAGMMVALWLPLVGVIVASRWRTSPSAWRRRFGAVLAFVSLWAMFNVSVCATWGAFRAASGEHATLGLLGALLVAQTMVPWLCAQIVATAPRPGWERDR